MSVTKTQQLINERYNAIETLKEQEIQIKKLKIKCRIWKEAFFEERDNHEETLDCLDTIQNCIVDKLNEDNDK